MEGRCCCVALARSVYKERKHLFERSKTAIRHQILYSEIAEVMAQFEIEVTARQCKAKVSYLMMKFGEEYYKNVSLLDGHPAIGNCFFCVDWYRTGKENKETSTAPRATRTRPTSLNTQKAKEEAKHKKPAVFKNWAKEAQEEQQRQRAEMLEVKRSREGCEERADRRLALMERFLDRLDKLNDK